MPAYDETVSAALIDIQIVDRPVLYQPLERTSVCGGECVFLGRTRMEVHPEFGVLRRLSYEAYLPLASQVLIDIASAACSRFRCSAARVHHAVGQVPVGEASVLVQVACGHRGEAFDACRFMIDRLKSQAPIWKREVWEHGETWSPNSHIVNMTEGSG